MKKLIFFFFILFTQGIAQSQSTFSWELDSYHDYPTYITLQFKSNGVSLGDDFASSHVQNLSNYHISFTVEFRITDFCGNTTTKYWPGGLNLKPGQSQRFPYAIAIKCKELKKEGSKATGIASVSCQVSRFRNITEEADKAKAERLEKEKELAEERARKDNELALKKKEEQEKRAEAERQRIAASNESNNNSSNSSNQGNNGSYYNNQNTTTTTTERKPTWEETNARIKAENQQKYNEQMARIAEQQRINEESSKQFVQNASEIINLAGEIFNQAREAKEKKELLKQQEKQEQEKARLREERRLLEIERKKAAKLALRNAFFAQFPDGGIPLSSQKITTSVLYYFTYLYDQNTISDANPNVYLSNIFEIAQYSDGTWPFKTSIINDLKKTNENKGAVILMGWFSNKEEAELKRISFLKLAAESEFTVKEITYKGKKASGSDKSDFWENGTTQPKTELRITKGDEDFWETGNAKKKIAKDKETTITKGDEDFWETGNAKRKIVEDKPTTGGKTTKTYNTSTIADSTNKKIIKKKSQSRNTNRTTNASDNPGKTELRVTKGDEDFWETGNAKKNTAEEAKKASQKKKTTNKPKKG